MPIALSSLARRFNRDDIKAIKRWAQYSKLDPALIERISELDLDSMLLSWERLQQGLTGTKVHLTALPYEVHGCTKIIDGQLSSIEINANDPLTRRLITLAHEQLHVLFYPKQPDHHSLHLLAVHLATQVFPHKTMKPNLFTTEELFSMRNVPLGDKGFPSAYDDGPVLYDATDRLKELFATVMQGRAPAGSVAPAVRVARPDAPAVRQITPTKAIAIRKQIPPLEDKTDDWRGWIIDQIRNAFESQQYIIPLKGVYRNTPTFNFSGYRAPTFEAFWTQLINSLNIDATNTTKQVASAVAAAGNATAAALTNHSIGAIVRLSDSWNQADNRPVTVQHFQAAGVEQDYVMGIELERGVAEWIVLHVNNDRGAGVPFARADLNVRIAADGVREGAVLTVETINLRDLQQ
jgi:hypothetical protein